MANKHEPYALKQRQSLPLEAKIIANMNTASAAVRWLTESGNPPKKDLGLAVFWTTSALSMSKNGESK